MADQIAALERVRDLLDRLERTRERLEDADGEKAVDVLRELSDLAKDVQVEIEQARRSGVLGSASAAGTGPAADAPA